MIRKTAIFAVCTALLILGATHSSSVLAKPARGSAWGRDLITQHIDENQRVMGFDVTSGTITSSTAPTGATAEANGTTATSSTTSRQPQAPPISITCRSPVRPAERAAPEAAPFRFHKPLPEFCLPPRGLNAVSCTNGHR
jgi:hypothetical protein